MSTIKTDNELYEEKDLIDTFMGRDHSRPASGHKFIGYHNSWDRLMPVVEKIESLGFRTGINYSTANNLHGATIYNWQADFKDTSTESKIGITYKVIVEFIKWYNQQSNG